MDGTTDPPVASGSAGQARPVAATITFAWVAMLVSYLPFSAANGALGRIGADTHAATALGTAIIGAVFASAAGDTSVAPAALMAGVHASALLLVTVIVITAVVSTGLMAPIRRSAS